MAQNADSVLEIMGRHQKGYRSTADEVYDRNPICQDCGHAWPCDTAIVVIAYFGGTKEQNDGSSQDGA